MYATVLGYIDDFSSPGTGAQNSPFCSPKLSSFLSLSPIQLASTTRMSSEMSLHNPSSAFGYSPASQIEYGRRLPSGRCSSFTPSTKSSPVLALVTSTVQLIVPSGPAFGSLREKSAFITGVGSGTSCCDGSWNTPSCSQRQRTMFAKAATTPLCQRDSGSPGILSAKPCSSRAF